MSRFLIITALFSSLIYAIDLKTMSKNNDEIRKNYLDSMVKTTVQKMDNKSIKEYEKYKQIIDTENKEKFYVIYFTSQSLDGSHQISITKEAARLSTIEHRIIVAPILLGFDDGVIRYAKKLNDYYEEFPPLMKENIRKSSTTLKLNPKLFKKFNITEVPVIVTAKCKNKINENTCKFFYMATGKASLTKISELANVSIENLFKEQVK